jgi:hypothetical protein
MALSEVFFEELIEDFKIHIRRDENGNISFNNAKLFAYLIDYVGYEKRKKQAALEKRNTRKQFILNRAKVSGKS